MRTIGIDFAAQPSNTVIAHLAWDGGRARVELLVSPADDDAVIASLPDAEAVGIDVPFGWPDAFIDFVVQHRDDAQPRPSADPDEWQRGLAYRLTDRVVADALRKQPLSVATDRIGLAAMRASSVLAAIREGGEPVDRAGGGRIVEVYPAAALKVWGLPYTGYKGVNADARSALVDDLLAAAPWLDLGIFAAECRRDDNALDAVIAGLIARAHALGHWVAPTAGQVAQASREGWMIVPTCELGALVGSP